MKKTKMIVICTEILVSISLIFLTACGDDEKSVASNFTSSIVTSETSASLGIYTYDTDNDGNSDKVVDRYGVDLSQVYTLKENGIYEGENLVLPLEQTEEFVPVTELIFTVTEKTVHPENSLYFLFVMLFMAVAFGVDAWQKKEMPQFLKATGRSEEHTSELQSR